MSRTGARGLLIDGESGGAGGTLDAFADNAAVDFTDALADAVELRILLTRV